MPIIEPIYLGNADDLESGDDFVSWDLKVTPKIKPYDFYKDLVGQPNKLVDQYIEKPLD
jgi:hypothetical protein